MFYTTKIYYQIAFPDSTAIWCLIIAKIENKWSGLAKISNISEIFRKVTYCWYTHAIWLGENRLTIMDIFSFDKSNWSNPKAIANCFVSTLLNQKMEL